MHKEKNEKLNADTKNAVYVSTAECIGSGSDVWKRVNGLTKPVLAEIETFIEKNGLEEITILVPSHTFYQNQQYKRAIYRGVWGWTHRQVDDVDYEIIYTIF